MSWRLSLWLKAGLPERGKFFIYDCKGHSLTMLGQQPCRGGHVPRGPSAPRGLPRPLKVIRQRGFPSHFEKAGGGTRGHEASTGAPGPQP
jgi:hypothetical protein